MDVVVEGGAIREVSSRPVSSGSADIVQCGGRTLMPGLIDAHVHVYCTSVDTALAALRPPTYWPHFASRFLRHSLDCGFTSVRDVGGGDIGLAAAIRDGLLTAPRFFYGGRILSQTGGHGDERHPLSERADRCCPCWLIGNDVVAIVDGADQMRAAVREELRRGANHIKITASGGVMSPADPLHRCQFSDEEIRVAVEEATRWGVYVAAHCHPAEAIRRCASLGVRSIEHGTLIDAQSAEAVAAAGAFVVPTMAVMFAMVEGRCGVSLPPATRSKLDQIAGQALEGLAIMRRAGVRMGFGTDLLGELYTECCSEFTLRARVLPPLEILRSVCAVNGQLLDEDMRLGRIAEGAYADLLLVDGDPIADISLLAHNGQRLAVIMIGGRFHKRSIG